MEAALYEVLESFRYDWGQKCVNVMRPLHEILYQQLSNQED